MRHTLQRNEAERQQLEDQLRQSQKMEALGRLAGGVAHDFNNLLTIIKGHSELLLDRLWTSPSLPTRVASRSTKLRDRASALTRQLLIFSRRQILQPKVLDLNVLIADMEKLLQRLFAKTSNSHLSPGADLTLCESGPRPNRTSLDESDRERLRRHAPRRQTHHRHADISWSIPFTRNSRPGLIAGSYVLLSAADTGHGMDAKTQARIFEPFFTTKEVGKGTGLGLSTVYGIVKQSSGFIYVHSAPEKGTCFEIFLPQVQEQCEPLTASSLVLPSAREAITVLVVEDDTAVRELACRFLDTAGFRVLAARDGVEALRIAGEHGSSIGCLYSPTS